jgi:hypothetical protein
MTEPAAGGQPLVEIAVEEYFRARERGEVIDRESFLRKYEEVADELAAFRDGDALLGAALPPTTARPARHDRAGQTIGRYTLVQKLGEGGMGEVWIATQAAPVKRKVALKLIK